MRRPTFFLRLAVLCLLASFPALQAFGQAATQGQWSALENWPTRAIHATLLPDGKVFFVSYYTESTQPHIWDPATDTFTATPAVSYELFCAGHTSLADGSVFIAGGHIADYTGYAHVSIYNPFSDTFSTAPDMNRGRWYPTATVLANGDVLVVSGDLNSNTSPDPLPQVLQMSSKTWRNLTTAQLAMPLYPVMILAPNGKVFNAGPSRLTRYLDTNGTGAWTSVGNMIFTGARDYGPGLMYDAGKVAEIGGADPPTATVETIDLNAATPAWRSAGSMHFPRRQHNAVILPNGKVFIVGGSSGSGFDDSSKPVLPTEMWDPSAGTFTVMASIATYRGYHSTALLLPDGRVLSAGGNVGGPNAQIYSPPYLFAGARPTITSAPSQVGYGQAAAIATPDAASISQVSWIHIGSTTHTFDMAARFMRLAFTTTSSGLTVTMPSSANVSPPGYYMLFILNGSGVPSVAKIIRIVAGGATTGTVTGTVTNNTGAPLGGATVTIAGQTGKTGNDGTFTLASIAPGSQTLAASLNGYQGASESVTVTAGNSTAAPSLQLTPVSPGNVTGQVVTSAGAAAGGVAVRGAGVSTTTDANGNYTLSNLPAGSVTLAASGTGNASASETVTITAGATVTAPVMTLGASTGAVTGKVTNSSGAAISGASVGFGGGSTTTASTGVYSLAGLPPGTIQLVASAAGFQSKTQTVNITAGATVTSNFTLAAATTGTATVTGKVTNASSGAALSSATVKWSGGSTTTSSTGVYTLKGVTAGSQTITASKTGYLSRSLKVTTTAGATSTLNIPIATAGKVAVKVTGTSGAAVSGATVSVKGGVVATAISGSTSSTGAYTTTWIPVGTYTVTISKTGHTTQSKTVKITSGATASLTFTGF